MKSEHDPAPAQEKLATIILAAGKGTRMRSDRAKVLHEVCGKPMLSYSIELARTICSEKIVLVIGHQAEEIHRQFVAKDIDFAYQTRQMGTGHAVMQTREVLQDFDGDILILCGDVPLLRVSTITALMEQHMSGNQVITMLTTMLENPTGYGRVVREYGDVVSMVVEERDASAEEKKIREINSGIYVVNSSFLYSAIGQIDNNNAQGEYYLTDIFDIARKMDYRTCASVTLDSMEVMGINTIRELEVANRIMAERRV